MIWINTQERNPCDAAKTFILRLRRPLWTKWSAPARRSVAQARAVRRFRRAKKSEWEWIARPVDGVAVTASDVIILRKELERCERAWGLFEAGGADSGAKASSPAKRPAGPGAPPKHDWDAFAGAIARRVHHHGMPVSQGDRVARYDGLGRGPGGFLGLRRTHGTVEGVGDIESCKAIEERLCAHNVSIKLDIWIHKNQSMRFRPLLSPPGWKPFGFWCATSRKACRPVNWHV